MYETFKFTYRIHVPYKTCYLMKYRLVQYDKNWYLRLGNKNIQRFGRNKELAEKVLELWQKQKYDVIYADPPWRYDFSKSNSRAIETHYDSMSQEDICFIKIPAKKDSVLFLWATAPKLPEAFEVMKAWGFNYKTNLVWIKDKIGMGYHARGRHEHLLVGTTGKGRLPAATEKWESVIYAERTRHSKKPRIIYEIIEGAYPDCKYLELFARYKRKNWDTWGNESE